MHTRHALSPVVSIALMALLACPASHAAPPMADTIYTGGDIVTVNELQPGAEAVAVRGGRIAAVGYRDQVMKLRGPKTRVIDLHGMTMIPGLIDAHGHVFGAGIQALSANLLPPPDGEGADIASLQRLLGDWAAKKQTATNKVGWIIGFGYDDSQLAEQRHPTRDELDKVSTTLPVVIVHQSGHLAVMNSKGLEVAGITAASKDPEGGVIRRKPGSQVKAPLYSRRYTNHLRIGGAKLNLDGSPQGRTAWLTKPYFKVPAGQNDDYLGYPAMTDEQANAYVDQAFAHGWQILAHVSGDAAIDQYIAAVIATRCSVPSVRPTSHPPGGRSSAA